MISAFHLSVYLTLLWGSMMLKTRFEFFFLSSISHISLYLDSVTRVPNVWRSHATLLSHIVFLCCNYTSIGMDLSSFLHGSVLVSSLLLRVQSPLLSGEEKTRGVCVEGANGCSGPLLWSLLSHWWEKWKKTWQKGKTMLSGWSIQYCKNINFPQSEYRVYKIPSRNPTDLFCL